MKIKCGKCGESIGKKQVRVFANGTEHIELKCTRCGKHIRYMPRDISGQEAESYVLPFGKYKGVVLSKVPRPYLEWMASQSPQGAAFRAIRQYLLDTNQLV